MSEPPPYARGEVEIKRRYLRIPSKQKDLLALEHAWDTTRQPPNVPPEILDDLRLMHTSTSSVHEKPIFSNGTEETSRASAHSQPQTPKSRLTSSPPLRGYQTPTRAQQDGNSSTRELSWSPSPARHLRPRPLKSSPALPEPVPEPSPARVNKGLLRSRPSLLTNTVFPSSSLGSDGDLEVVAPQPLTARRVDKIVRAAQQTVPAPTPPSAQLPVPSTMPKDDPPASRTHRPRKMKAPPFGTFRSSVVDEPVVAVHASPGRRKKMKPVPQSSGVSNSGRPDSSIPPSITQPTAETDESPVKASKNQGLLRAPATGESSQSSSGIPPNGPASQFPYVAFTYAYPKFAGSEGDFLRAALILVDLGKKRALAEFLYDDFIRVFCGPYLQYIEHIATDTQKPLTAVQWYNENVKQPEYHKCIMTKDMVAGITERYPEQVRAIRDGISQSSETKKSQETETHDHLEPEQVISTSETVAQPPSSPIGQSPVAVEPISEPQPIPDGTPTETLDESSQKVDSGPPSRAQSPMTPMPPTPPKLFTKSRLSEIPLVGSLPDGPALSSFMGPYPQPETTPAPTAERPSLKRSSMADRPITATPRIPLSTLPNPSVMETPGESTLGDSSFLSEEKLKRKRKWEAFLDKKHGTPGKSSHA